jgi:hypothetical protein
MPGIWVYLRFAASAQISTKCSLRRTDSRIGDPQRLVNPGGFDKADAPGAGPAFQNSADYGDRFATGGTMDPIHGGEPRRLATIAIDVAMRIDTVSGQEKARR